MSGHTQFFVGSAPWAYHCHGSGDRAHLPDALKEMDLCCFDCPLPECRPHHPACPRRQKEADDACCNDG